MVYGLGAMHIVARSQRRARAEAAQAGEEALDRVQKDYDLDTLTDVLVIIRASKDLTIVDINGVTDVVSRRVHEDAELEISASSDLDGGDDVEIAIAIPQNTPKRRKKRRAAD